MNFDFPKVDLHFHLDGSISAEFSWKMVKEKGIKVEAKNFEEFKKSVEVDENCKSLYDFLKCFDIPVEIMQDEKSLEECTYEVINLAAKEGIVYLEIRFAPQLHKKKGLDEEKIVKAVLKGMERGMKNNSSIKVSLILCAMVLGKASLNHEDNMKTIRVAKKFLGKGVVAVDLAGAEGVTPMENFRDLFEEANKLNIPFTIHAGESMGPENIKMAISFGAKRIGHGVTSIKSEKVMKEIKDKNITLEMCITSNVKCNVVPSLKEHPIKKLYDYGIKVTVNTDDMAILNTNINKEYEILIKELGFTYNDLIKMNINSIEASFMKEEEKQFYLEKLKKYIKELIKKTAIILKFSYDSCFLLLRDRYRKLAIIKVSIKAFLFYKFFMGSLFYYMSFIHYEY